MDSYVKSDYYYDTFEGNVIPQDKFENLALRASSKIRNCILNKDISLFQKDIQNATCSVAEILYNQDLSKERLRKIVNGSDKIISSEKVGDWSRNYSNISIEEIKKISDEDYTNILIYETLENYLLWTGLLYSGVSYV